MKWNDLDLEQLFGSVGFFACTLAYGLLAAAACATELVSVAGGGK